MKIQIEVNGKKIDAIVDDEAMRAVLADKQKNSGYERIDGEQFFYATNKGDMGDDYDDDGDFCTELYNNANYYSSILIARDNIRADNLMRQIRRFAATIGELVSPQDEDHWSIGFMPSDEDEDVYELVPIGVMERQNFGEVCFKTAEGVERAIHEFQEELTWYFESYSGVKG